MNKAVLLSIHPKWCEKILSGEKTIEIRKTKPKIKTPFKCYIYCTKERNKNDGLWGDPILKNVSIDGEEHVEYASGMPYLNGSVIGEFVCDKIDIYPAITIGCAKFEVNGGEVAEKLRYNAGACMDAEAMFFYSKGKDLYGWHLSDLKIYDKPKGLSNFFVKGECDGKGCAWCSNFYRGTGYLGGSGFDEDDCIRYHIMPLTKPPLSWCYVEKI